MRGASLLRANALTIPLADETVDAVISSPPYFSLRSYQDDGGHYDGQIGSEATPAAFLDALWAVTAECKRVLKPSGSMFVNLGDSYAGSGGYNNSNIGADGRGPASYRRNRRGVSTDGAPSDWTNANAAWLAGVIDSDGSISCRQFTPTPDRSPSFVPWVRVGQMRPEVVNRCHQVTGVGRVFEDKRGCWHWNASSQQARYVLERIWPWLLIKQRQALAAIEIARHVADFGASGGRKLGHNEIAHRASLRQAIHDWNQGHTNNLEPPRPRPVELPDRHIDPPAKSLHGLPWRYAIGCIDRLDLILRAEIIWSKPNGLPESVTDRPRRSHEQWFMFTKEPRYYSAIDEIRESHSSGHHGATRNERTDRRAQEEARYGHRPDVDLKMPPQPGDPGAFHPLGKLPGSVWTIPSEPLKVPDWLCVDHFAAFPQEWPRRLILGWTPNGVCVECQQGRWPTVDKTNVLDHASPNHRPAYRDATEPDGNTRGLNGSGGVYRTEATITGYACGCDEPTAPTRPAVVLDPFAGTGTTVMVARALGRYGIGLDLSADYLRLARWRVFQSGHASKSIERRNREAQGTLL